MLRFLTVRCVVAQHTDDGGAWYSSDRQLFWRIVGTRCALDGPLPLKLFLERDCIAAAGQKPASSEDSI
jgi:hypothetical protein